jgi:hypothetical protein
MDGRTKSCHDDVATRWAKMRIAEGRRHGLCRSGGLGMFDTVLQQDRISFRMDPTSARRQPVIRGGQFDPQ